MATHYVVVHGIDHARLALAEAARRGDRVVLVSAEGAALYAGAGWFRELVAVASAEYPGVLIGAILDCGDAPGTALGALRAGVQTITLEAPPPVLDKVAAIAEELDARLVPRPVEPMLDLVSAADPASAIQRWFAKDNC